MSEPVDRNSADQDLDLVEYLGGNSRVSQRYRALAGEADASVPPELDRLILAQAQRAIAPDAPATAFQTDALAVIRGRRRRLLQWSVPTALAASLVLVVSIVMQSGVEHQVRSTTLPAIPVQSQAPAPVVQSSPAPDRQHAAAQQRSQSSSVVAKPEPVPRDLSGVQRSRPAASVPVEAAATPHQLPHAAIANPAAPPPPPEPTTTPAAETRVAPMAAAPSLESTAAPQADVSSPATAVRQRASERHDAATAGSATQMARKERNEPQAAAAVKSAPEAAAAQAVDQEADTAWLHADPDAWLKHIRQLRREGKRELADREWQRFSAEYPAYPVAESDPARAAKAP